MRQVPSELPEIVVGYRHFLWLSRLRRSSRNLAKTRLEVPRKLPDLLSRVQVRTTDARISSAM